MVYLINTVPLSPLTSLNFICQLIIIHLIYSQSVAEELLRVFFLFPRLAPLKESLSKGLMISSINFQLERAILTGVIQIE